MDKKPILFSGEMVRAVLEGRKTQTRRVIKSKVALDWLSKDMFTPEFVASPENNLCPYGKPGDRLWVRETWQGMSMQTAKWWHEVPRSERPLHNWQWTNPVEPALQSLPPRWLPGIHMPYMVCRVTLEVVSVRVEKIQEITCADAAAEGVNGDNDAELYACFQDLWDKINGPRGYGWDVNPWVWVVEFKGV